MRDILIVLKETCLIRNECWEYFKKKPSSWSLWDYGVSIAPVFYAMGKPESMEYYKHLIAELKERAKKNIPVLLPEGEKYRLFWDGWLPWAFLGRVIRMLVPKGALPICGRYPWEFFHIPEDINPDADDIVHEWVRIWYTGRAKGAYHDGPWGGEEFIEELVNEYSIDGIVMFSSKTCRMFNLGQWEILNKMDRKCGVPGVVIEADMVDSSMFSEAQIQTRLQALFETIDARRK
jgi:benzoyl-CoA reductase/2-hydroxyglutaryl-CoA dehydratase subunit BcrC/BadD/HgdB